MRECVCLPKKSSLPGRNEGMNAIKCDSTAIVLSKISQDHFLIVASFSLSALLIFSEQQFYRRNIFVLGKRSDKITISSPIVSRTKKNARTEVVHLFASASLATRRSQRDKYTKVHSHSHSHKQTENCVLLKFMELTQHTLSSGFQMNVIQKRLSIFGEFDVVRAA